MSSRTPFGTPSRCLGAPVPEPLFDDLYRELILDHYRRPRHRGALANPTVHVEGMNPVCGDEVRIDMAIVGETVREIAFDGQGCSISQASASMLATQVYGKSIEATRTLSSAFKAMLVDGALPTALLGDLEALEGVAKFPVRVKCALLPWNVLEQGLNEAASKTKELSIG